MQEFIAGLLAVLGTLLVLAGATITVLKTLTPATDVPVAEGAPADAGRLRRTLQRIQGADRLIGWGVVVLALATLASGALTFDVGASVGTGSR